MPPIDKPFILHIGRHKSGTSALQKALHKNYDALYERGFLYPQKCRSEPAHHRISSHFLPPGRKHFSEQQTQRAVRKLRAEANAFDGKVILSSEGFQNCPPDALTALCPPQQTQIVVYLREQYTYAQSAYSQAVQGGKNPKTFEEYLQGFNANYMNFLKKWRTKFKPKQLSVRIYDRPKLENGDIIDDFLATCGVDLADIKKPTADPNVSIGGPLLEFKRAINTLQIPPGELAKIKAYRVLARVARSDPKYRAKPTASEGAVEQFRARFRESNQRLSEKYFGGSEIFSFATPVQCQGVSLEDMECVLDCISDNMGEPIFDLIRQVSPDKLTDPTAKMIRDHIG